MQYGTAKKGLLLSAKQRTTRVAFARRNSDRDWRSVMFTDSKIFCLHKTRAKLWFPKEKASAAPPQDCTQGPCLLRSHMAWSYSANLCHVWWDPAEPNQ